MEHSYQRHTEQHADHHAGQHAGQHATHEEHGHHYRGLAVMTVLSFAAMYVLMYAMVDTLPNVYANVNQAYMAGLMTAPMVVIMLLVMRSMYRNTRWNAVIHAASILLGIVCFVLIRQQAAVGDRQFLRSMIPHHGGAILMCSKAPITEPEIQSLCRGILASQTQEIVQMKAMLSR
jgi:uncharacterized protein (DUF305 family)